ncbi:MAG TPA: DUF6458 family protein [Acidimicrobiales bacterium]|nr:DUF6458 family protein [Acidimicrobiales bacterium]
MGIGVSIFLVAIGAILTFAVEATVSGIDINTIGIILMVVGGIGLLFSLMALSSVSRRGDAVVEERVVDRTY